MRVCWNVVGTVPRMGFVFAWVAIVMVVVAIILLDSWDGVVLVPPCVGSKVPSVDNR